MRGTGEPLWHPDGASPDDGRIFVFGANRAGRHGAGAARAAQERFGAVPGQGEDLQGQSYGVPTKDAQLRVLALDAIHASTVWLAALAWRQPDLRFFITRVGCGLAGYRDEDIAPMFRLMPAGRCSFPEAWRPWLTVDQSPIRHVYAGIGSRLTPEEVQSLMTRIARRLLRRGYVLRSGAARGADAAFEAGAADACQIFLPWAGYNRNRSRWIGPAPVTYLIAAHLHPNWLRLGKAAKSLMARNVHQILGPGLERPVEFVVCWTADGAESEAECSRTTGGTGLAITLASRFGIPTFNLARTDALHRLGDLLQEAGD